ncbi:MAG: hypothetical protein AB1715_02965 [Acidobacteriota bacterium]
MSRFFKFFFGIGAVIFLVSAYPAGTKDALMYADTSQYIEVCSSGLAYVPPETRYVTCQGKVMKVLAIVPLEEAEGAQTEGGGADDCYCPRCCGGVCAVIVSCGAVPETAAAYESGRDSGSPKAGGLCTIYLACD